MACFTPKPAKSACLRSTRSGIGKRLQYVMIGSLFTANAPMGTPPLRGRPGRFILADGAENLSCSPLDVVETLVQ